MKIIGTYNIKGGVGKTATAVNLACLAAMEGYKTLLWDLDPQGAASFYYRIKPKIKGGSDRLLAERNLDNVIKGTDIPGLDLIPADFSYRNMDVQFSGYKKPARQLMKLLRPLSEEYHLLFIDCPPEYHPGIRECFLCSRRTDGAHYPHTLIDSYPPATAQAPEEQADVEAQHDAVLFHGGSS